MSVVIVPDFVHDAITSALDRELALFPEAEAERGQLYNQLLEYYNENGTVPDFSITKKDAQ
jgi:hypothetical protein